MKQETMWKALRERDKKRRGIDKSYGHWVSAGTFSKWNELLKEKSALEKKGYKTKETSAQVGDLKYNRTAYHLWKWIAK